jgi:hypothetical protein
MEYLNLRLSALYFFTLYSSKRKINLLELSLENVNTPHVQAVLNIRVEGEAAVAAYVAQLVNLETLLVGDTLNLEGLLTIWEKINRMY